MIVLEEKTMYSQYIRDFLQGKAEGEILLVTSKGIYIRLANRVLQVTASSFGVTPIGIGIEKVDFLKPLDLKAGQTVWLKDGALHFPGGILKIRPQAQDATMKYAPLKSEIINLAAQSLKDKRKTTGVSSLCASLLDLDGSSASYSNTLCEIAHPLLNELIQSLQGCQADGVHSAVRQLIGMGIGLTPSLDDVILGMLYTLLRIAPESKQTKLLKTAVTECAKDGTNTISAAYLLAVADGAPFGRLDDVLRGLSGEIPLDMEPILEIGSSSGSEMLLGLLIAAKIIYL